MLHNRTLNNKINRIHERALRVVYQNKTLTFDELLLKDNSVRVHHFLKLTLISIIYIINIVVCKCVVNYKERKLKKRYKKQTKSKHIKIYTQIHKYTNTQIHKYTNTQIYKYTNIQKSSSLTQIT